MHPQPNPLTELLRLNPAIVAAAYDDPHNPTKVIVHLQGAHQLNNLKMPTNAPDLPHRIIQAAPIRTLTCPVGTWTMTNLHQACQHEPIQLGTQLQPEHGNWYGTAGAPVSWIDAQGARHWGILSNWHVMHGDYLDHRYDQHQPTVQHPVCAVLSKSTPIHQDAPNLVDAAIADARIDGYHTIANRILEIATPPGKPLSASVGMTVCKSGRTTGLTHGTCVEVGASVRVGYDDFTALFEDQDVFQGTSGSFSAPGDSGSLIIRYERNQPTALLFAGNGVLTIGCPMRHVIEALNLVFPFN